MDEVKFEEEVLARLAAYPFLVVAGQHVRYRLGGLPGTTELDETVAGLALRMAEKLGVGVVRYDTIDVTRPNGPERVAQTVGLAVQGLLTRKTR